MPPFSRRTFFQVLRNLALFGGASALAGYGYVFHFEPRWIAVERRTLPIRHLPAGLEGLRIVQLSDLHLSPTPLEFLRAAVAQVNALQPDLVVLTGDYVYESAEAIFDLAPVLAGLNARYGVYTILGNHDHWSNSAVVTQGLTEARLPVLVNQGVPLSIGGDTLYLAGLDDGWSQRPGRGPDLRAALAQHTGTAPVVLLMHEPDFADEFAADPRVTVQLSGHSHGGQVRLPFVGAVALPPYGQKYDMGLYAVQNLWLYTNRGLGTIRPVVRFNCRPEIAQLTLTSG